MRIENRLFPLLGVFDKRGADLKNLADQLDIPIKTLKYYNAYNILPYEYDLDKIEKRLGITKLQVMLSMGILSSDVLDGLSKNHVEVSKILSGKPKTTSTNITSLAFETDLGKLYTGDCTAFLSTLNNESVDSVFADPPFNLNKVYESGVNDDLSSPEYLNWCEKWIDECVRILKPGGSFFLWNIPKWNTYLSDYLNGRLNFRHWISVDIKYSLPVQGRLYPSHYSLLYYTKGEKPITFTPDRLPMEVCKNCFKEIKDYGGYKDKMNPKGINISDVWFDIPPVRHSKYKNRDANELSVRLLDRIIEMSTREGDIILDPFGGSGTTYIVSEIKKRKWIGVELGSPDSIIDRFKNIERERMYLNSIRKNYNKLFTDEVKTKRTQLSLWTDETFTNNNL